MIFNLDKTLNLNVIEDQIGNTLEYKIETLDSKYKVTKDGRVLIDFLKIIDEFDMKDYDVNLKSGNGIHK